MTYFFLHLNFADRHNLTYYNALSGAGPDGNLQSCDAYSSSAAVSLTQGQGVSRMVLAPEVVEHHCAVYVGSGAYLDLGDFAGTCVSDPDVCVSNSVTWSLWLKINSSGELSGDRFFLSSGGRTRKARGVAFLFRGNENNFLFAARSLRKSWSRYQLFQPSRIPRDAWFNLVATVDLTQVNANLRVYLNGGLLTENGAENVDVSQSDGCTRLFLGNANSCPTIGTPSALTYGTSAAFSNLMVFDGLLTEEQIGNLYACGSLGKICRGVEPLSKTFLVSISVPKIPEQLYLIFYDGQKLSYLGATTARRCDRTVSWGHDTSETRNLGTRYLGTRYLGTRYL